MVIELDIENFLFNKATFNLSNKVRFIPLHSAIAEIFFYYCGRQINKPRVSYNFKSYGNPKIRIGVQTAGVSI